VTNWGGRRAESNDRTATSGGTDTVVDERGIAASGTVSLVDLDARREMAQVAVGLSPAAVALSRDGVRCTWPMRIPTPCPSSTCFVGRWLRR